MKNERNKQMEQLRKDGTVQRGIMGYEEFWLVA